MGSSVSIRCVSAKQESVRNVEPKHAKEPNYEQIQRR